MNRILQFDRWCDKQAARLFPRFVAWGNEPYILPLTNATRLCLIAVLVCPWLIVARLGMNLNSAHHIAASSDRLIGRLTIERMALKIEAQNQQTVIEKLQQQLNPKEIQ